MIGVKSDKKHMGREHRAAPGKQRGVFSVPRVATDSGGPQ